MLTVIVFCSRNESVHIYMVSSQEIINSFSSRFIDNVIVTPTHARARNGYDSPQGL